MVAVRNNSERICAIRCSSSSVGVVVVLSWGCRGSYSQFERQVGSPTRAQTQREQLLALVHQQAAPHQVALPCSHRSKFGQEIPTEHSPN